MRTLLLTLAMAACATANTAVKCAIPEAIPIEQAVALCVSQGGDPLTCAIDFVTQVLAPYLECIDPQHLAKKVILR